MQRNYPNHRTPWTLQHMQMVELHYKKIPTSELARMLGRTETAVRLTAQSLGISENINRPWSEEEIAVLRNEYARGESIHRVLELIPGRSRETIYQKARMLGIASGVKWTTHDYYILKKYYPIMGAKVAEMLGRTRAAVKRKALDLNISADTIMARQHWSMEEKQLLVDNLNVPLETLKRLLPRRSTAAITKAMQRLLNRSNVKTAAE